MRIRQVFFLNFLVAILVILFFILRLPFIKKYKLNYISKIKLDSGAERIDLILALICMITWVILPLCWSLGLISIAQIQLPAFLKLIGLISMTSGVTLTYYAHKHLDLNWSAVAEIRSGHSLVTNGVYRYIRHPMYSAFFLLVIGILLATSNLFVGPLALTACAILYANRVSKEETMLLSEFGDEYLVYSKSTGRLIPKIRII